MTEKDNRIVKEGVAYLELAEHESEVFEEMQVSVMGEVYEGLYDDDLFLDILNFLDISYRYSRRDGFDCDDAEIIETLDMGYSNITEVANRNNRPAPNYIKEVFFRYMD